MNISTIRAKSVCRDNGKFIGNAVVPVVVSRWAEQYFREINGLNHYQLTMF